MIRKSLKGFISGFVVAVLLISSVSVFASGAIRENIEIIKNNIKLVIDGKPVEFGKDADGKQIEPFIYNGTTYLPVRAVGEAVGKKVDWDGATQTVYLGEKPGETNYMTEVLNPYNNNNTTIFNLNDTEILDIAGTEFKTGYRPSSWRGGELKFNLNSLYKELTFSYGPSYSYKNKPGTLNIYLDNNLYENLEINENDPVKTMTIKLTGVNQIRFEFKNIDGNTFMGIGDPTIK